jgi:hypothetical protein
VAREFGPPSPRQGRPEFFKHRWFNGTAPLRASRSPRPATPSAPLGARSRRAVAGRALNRLNRHLEDPRISRLSRGATRPTPAVCDTERTPWRKVPPSCRRPSRVYLPHRRQGSWGCPRAPMSAGDRHPSGFHDQHLGCGGSPRWVADRRRQAPCLPAMLALVMERALPWPPPRRALPTLDRVVERHDEGARFGRLRSGGAPTQRPRRGQLATKPRARPGRAPTCVAGAMSLCTGSCSKRGVPPARPTQPRGEAGSKRHNLGFVSDEPPSVSRAVPTPPTRGDRRSRLSSRGATPWRELGWPLGGLCL